MHLPSRHTGRNHRSARRSLLAVGAALLAMLVPSGSADAATCSTPMAVAHRGDAAHVTGDTRAAFRSASAKGAHAWEMDVRFTRTDVPVVLHDADLGLFGHHEARVADLSLARTRSWLSSDRQNMPTLTEVLSDDPPRGVLRYLVELKVAPTPAQWQAFDARFRWTGVTTRSVIMSYDPAVVRAARARGYATALQDYRTPRTGAEVAAYGTSYVVNIGAINAALAAQWRAAGVAVYAWTPDDPASWARMAYDRVTGVITNRPAEYLAWAAARCGTS